MADDAENLRRRLNATREAMLAGVPHETIRHLVETGRLDALAQEAARTGGERDAVWNRWKAARATCPLCNGVGVHLLYGMPGPLGAVAAQAGDVHLAGQVPPEPLLWHCTGCGHQWGRADDDPMPLRRPS